MPPGFWVHNLEHGGIAFLYNCPGGCAAEVAAAQAIIDAYPIDPSCAGQGTDKRILMAPDPTLDVRWAAAAWGQILRETCFDAAALSSFLVYRYGMGPEATCWNGEDATMAGHPANCGK